MLRAIIIEDELSCHRILQDLLKLESLPVDIIGNAYTVEEGITLANKEQPELIFLDIQINDKLGFEVLKALGSAFEYQVIFTTGYDNYTINAIRVGALDYLIKPINREELKFAVEKAIKIGISKGQDQISRMLEALNSFEHKQFPKHISLSTLERIHLVLVDDIIKLDAHKNYTTFTVSSLQKPIMVSTSIGEYESVFQEHPDFIRVHRSNIINLKHVQEFVKTDGGYLLMKDGSSVNVSRRYKEGLIKRISTYSK